MKHACAMLAEDSFGFAKCMGWSFWLYQLQAVKGLGECVSTRRGCVYPFVSLVRGFSCKNYPEGFSFEEIGSQREWSKIFQLFNNIFELSALNYFH